MKHAGHQLKTKGFTLTEIMMAIVLSSLMIVSIFGVMGTAQINVNGAELKSTQARISQQIVSEILLNDWSSILDCHDSDRYFDAEGNQVEVSNETNSEAMWAYRAKIKINETQAEVPGAPEPDEDVEAAPVMSRKVVVKITNGYFLKYDFEEGTRHKNFPTWIAKTDKM